MVEILEVLKALDFKNVCAVSYHLEENIFRCLKFPSLGKIFIPYHIILNIFEVEMKWSNRWSKFCSCLTNALTSQSNSNNCQVLAGVQFFRDGHLVS